VALIAAWFYFRALLSVSRSVTRRVTEDVRLRQDAMAAQQTSGVHTASDACMLTIAPAVRSAASVGRTHRAPERRVTVANLTEGKQIGIG
jgi:hypothetical protein